MGGLAIGLFSWQYRKTKRLQARVHELEAQQTAQHAPVAVQEEYEPAPLCTLDTCRFKGGHHTHITKESR